MQDYFKAQYPDEFQVLGVPLLPFSLGHYFKLRRIGCAFVSDSPAGATLRDLLLGIAVCSMRSHPDPAKDPFWQWLSGQPSLRLKVRNIFMRLLGKIPLSQSEYEVFRWGKKCGMFDFKAKAKLFHSYIQHHSTPPGFWEEPRKDAKESGAHWSHAILTALVSKCGYTMESAYNAPLGQCLFDFYKLAENEGGGRMMTEEESKLQEVPNGT